MIPDKVSMARRIRITADLHFVARRADGSIIREGSANQTAVSWRFIPKALYMRALIWMRDTLDRWAQKLEEMGQK